jgi:hypothetical protein
MGGFEPGADRLLRRALPGRAGARPRHDPPAAIRRLADSLDLDATSSSHPRSRDHAGDALAPRLLLGRNGGRGEFFVCDHRPGSELESLAHERGFARVFAGSRRSAAGIRRSRLSGSCRRRCSGSTSRVSSIGRARWSRRAASRKAIRPRARQQFGEGWQRGRDKICIDETRGGFGLWAEQLIAESTGKDGKGLVPGAGESAERADRQRGEVRLEDPYELGQEFFRWEFAVAVAGSYLEINPFDQPDVQAAKDKTNEVLAGGDVELEPESRRGAVRAGERGRLRRDPGLHRPEQEASSSR